MLTAPEPTIVLSDEQIAAIEVAQARLINIQSEVELAAKNLGVIKKDTTKAVAERLFEEKSKETLQSEINDLLLNKQSLISDVASLETEHSRIVTEINELSSSLDARQKELEEREEAITSHEVAYCAQKKELDVVVVKVNQDLLEIGKAKAAFLTACETVSWKYNKE